MVLQNIDLQRQKWLLSKVQELGIRFPVADIAAKTGMDEGNISSYLKGKKPISDNFLTKFREAYGIGDDNIGDPTTKQILLVLAEAFKSQAEMLKSIESKMAQETTQARINNKVNELEVTLGHVLNGLTAAAGRQAADREVVLAALSHLRGKKQGDLLREANKRAAEIFEAGAELGKQTVMRS